MDKLFADAVWEVLWDTLLIEYPYRGMRPTRRWYKHHEYNAIVVTQPLQDLALKPTDIAIVLEVIVVTDQDMIVLRRANLEAIMCAIPITEMDFDIIILEQIKRAFRSGF